MTNKWHMLLIPYITIFTSTNDLSNSVHNPPVLSFREIKNNNTHSRYVSAIRLLIMKVIELC